LRAPKPPPTPQGAVSCRGERLPSRQRRAPASRPPLTGATITSAGNHRPSAAARPPCASAARFQLIYRG